MKGFATGIAALLGLAAQAAPELPPEVRRQLADIDKHGALTQETDLAYDTSVVHPAYTVRHPAVLIDAAHRNFHTPATGYRPFAGLIASDGYRIATNERPFSAATLAGHDVLVIANAGTPEAGGSGDAPAFTDEECRAVSDWVRGGGALLLIADHAPFGTAAEPLARAFGVEMSKGVTADRDHADPETGNASFILYRRDDGRFGSHPILDGRDASERIGQVMTFSGQSLRGPRDSVVLLSLGENARDRAQPSQAEVQTAIAAARESARREGRAAPVAIPMTLQNAGTSAAGRAQALAFRFGRGRVVVLGEAAMLSAQRVSGRAFGMNRPGIDNRQFALNVMHWLSGLLD